MKESTLIDAVNGVELKDDMKERLLRACLDAANADGKRRFRRFGRGAARLAAAAAGVALCLGLVWGVLWYTQSQAPPVLALPPVDSEPDFHDVPENPLMTKLGYSMETLEAIAEKATPYIGDAPRVSAIIGLLPEPQLFNRYDSFSLRTSVEPYILTINYVSSDYEGTEISTPFGAAAEENNALLLFAAIGNLSEIHYQSWQNTEPEIFTREGISEIFGGIPALDGGMRDLLPLYRQLGDNLGLDEFYFAHASRIYLGDAPEDVEYRNMEPDEVVTLPGGMLVYSYKELGRSGYIPEGSEDYVIVNPGVTSLYYFKYSDGVRSLYATRFFASDGAESYDDIAERFGPPATEQWIPGGGRKYISYLLRAEAEKRAYFVFEENTLTEYGLMAGDDYSALALYN